MLRNWLLVLAIAAALPAAAQPDPAGGLVIMGWSKNSHVAMRNYSESFGIEHSCSFSAIIVNLVTDEVVWTHAVNWNEGNDGEGKSPQCPGAKAAWAQARPEVEAALTKYGITGPESRTVKKFPAGSLTVSVELEKETYQVKATSEPLGAKVLSRGDVVDWDEGGNGAPAVLGWIGGPDKNRIAVILQPPCFPQSPCSMPTAVGCHLKAGFKK